MATFSHTSDCNLEIHCSPFGLSGMYLKVAGSDAVGIGSTMARLSGATTGKLHYNATEDLTNTKYKLYGLLEEDDILRIDFIKIFVSTAEEQRQSGNGVQEQLAFENPGDAGYENPDIVFRGKVPAGRPDMVEPFIGIFNFERPSNL